MLGYDSKTQTWTGIVSSHGVGCGACQFLDDGLFGWMSTSGPENLLSLFPELILSLFFCCTQLQRRYYPTHKRLMRYCESVVVTTVMLLVALVFMICSLNLQVREDEKHEINSSTDKKECV